MRQGIEISFAGVEKALMPAVTGMLDALIDSAQGARPGIDGLRYATDIRVLADQAERASRELAELMFAAREAQLPGNRAAA